MTESLRVGWFLHLRSYFSSTEGDIIQKVSETAVQKEDLLNAYLRAYEQLERKVLAFRKVAGDYGVSVERVKALVRRHKPDRHRLLKPHSNLRLSQQQEEGLVGIILGLAMLSKPLTIDSTVKIANKAFKIEEPLLGRKWFTNFYQRWSALIILKEARLISAGRSSPEIREDVKDFLAFHSEFRKNYRYPEHAIFNVDESRVTLSDTKRSARRLLARSNPKTGIRGARSRKHCSVIPFVSAAGETISVFYILAQSSKAKVLSVPHTRRNGGPSPFKEYYLTTENGYSTTETFQMMVAQFGQDFAERYPGLNSVLYMDRLGSHTTPEILATALENHIQVVLLPANTTHFLQPLDDCVFGLFKTLLQKYNVENLVADPLREGLARDPLLTAMPRALRESLKPQVITASFRNTGLCPWNPDLIWEKTCAVAPGPVSPSSPSSSILNDLMTAVTASSPRNEEIVVSKFRLNQKARRKIFTLDGLVENERQYEEERDKEAQEKQVAQEARKSLAAKKRQTLLDQKKAQGEAKKAAKKRKNLRGGSSPKRGRKYKCSRCR